MTYVIIFLVALILVLTAILFAQRQVEQEKQELIKQGGEHVHHWKQITEFARQCLDHRCRIVEVTDNAPDGMKTYLSLMTTERAREYPIEEAGLYPQFDPRMDKIAGNECPECWAVYPKDFPWCPFCDTRPIPHMIYDEEKKLFIEATPETILRLAQARKDRNVKLRAQDRAQLESPDRPSERANSRN